MLREATTIRNTDGQIRRWFYDDNFDLIVWLDQEENHIDGFELCYSDPAATQVEIRWSCDTGFAHLIQDKDHSLKGRKGTTVFSPLERSGTCRPLLDSSTVAQFHVASLTLSPMIRDFILDKLEKLA